MPATHFRHGVSNLDLATSKGVANEMVKHSLQIAVTNVGGDTTLALPGLKGIVVSAAIDVTAVETTALTKTVGIGIQGGSATAFATALSTAGLGIVGNSAGTGYTLGDTVSLTFAVAHTQFRGTLYVEVLALEKILL